MSAMTRRHPSFWLVGGLLAAFGCGGGAGSSPPPASAKDSSQALPQLPPVPKDPHAIAAGGGGEVPPFPEADDNRLTPPDHALHVRARNAAREGRLLEAKQILGHLAFAYSEHTVLVDQYNAVTAKMDSTRATAKASLEAAPLRKLDAPPAKYTLVKEAPASDKRVPKLVKKSEKNNNVVDVERWFKTNGVHGSELFVPPVSDMLFAPGTISTTTVVNLLTGFKYTEYEPQARFDPRPLPQEIPVAYGSFPLTRALDSKPYFVAIYSDRVVAVFDGKDHVKALFDLEQYVHPPADKTKNVVVGRATLTTAEGTASADITVGVHSVTLDLRFARVADGVLYVEHASRTYAKESQGQTAYISAIDLETGSLLWRSAPLVANGESFTLVQGSVVCGYGFSAEPDFLFVLDRATGATKQKIPVKSGPEEILLKDERSLLVRTYDTDLVFDVR
jgi:hypothetical protein